MLSIRYTELAETDLFNIYIYTYQTWGASQAQSYTNTLKIAIARIAEKPTFPGTVDRSSVYPGCRSYRVKSHLIFYRPVEDALEILRILHINMDISSRLAETLEEEES